MHPYNGRVTGLNDEGKPLSEIESYLLNRSPTFLSSQERFVVFQHEIQKRMSNGCSLASLPCGLMTDLLTLDYSNFSDYHLTGIDIDEESIQLALQESEKCGQLSHTDSLLLDAWKMTIEGEFDILTSNGLNFYEPDDEKVIDLYRRYYHSLKPGGWLVTSFLTPASEWRWDSIVAEDAMLQTIIFRDILDCKWQIYRTSEQTIQQLREAGFDDVEVIADVRGMFPTVIARKPL
jgi:SAM-dependent methyltransferase